MLWDTDATPCVRFWLSARLWCGFDVFKLVKPLRWWSATQKNCPKCMCIRSWSLFILCKYCFYVFRLVYSTICLMFLWLRGGKKNLLKQLSHIFFQSTFLLTVDLQYSLKRKIIVSLLSLQQDCVLLQQRRAWGDPEGHVQQRSSEEDLPRKLPQGKKQLKRCALSVCAPDTLQKRPSNRHLVVNLSWINGKRSFLVQKRCLDSRLNTRQVKSTQEQNEAGSQMCLLMAELFNLLFMLQAWPRPGTSIEWLRFVPAGRPEVIQILRMPEIPNVLYITVKSTSHATTDVFLKSYEGSDKQMVLCRL